MRLAMWFTGALLFILPVQQVWAHGGGHDAPAAQAQEPLPELAMDHAMAGDMDNDTAVDDFYGAENSASMADEVPLDLGTADMADHAGHTMPGMPGMPEVTIAEHEWNSTSQKGYGLAVGITLLSGLGFLFLSLKRPFE